MPRLIDIEKEKVFIKTYAQTGNATHSARVCGYDSNPRQMGSYLKNKNIDEIETCTKTKLNSMSGAAIAVVQELLHSKSDMCKLKAAEYILKLSGYGEGSAKPESESSKLQKMSDDELANAVIDFAMKIPNVRKKLEENLKDFN